VPENELKWAIAEPQPGQFNFAPADSLLAFASEHNMKFRGHTLVWHKQIPKWAGVGDAAAVRPQLLSHIAGEVAHYRGHADSWDVVNEAIEPKDGRADGLRNTLWLKALGPQYIDLAFRAAAEADPNALLVLNDYDLEADSPAYDRRRAAILALATRLKNSGVPIQALGIQAHLDATEKFNPAKFAAFLNAISALGLKIFITEMDVADRGLPANVDTRDRLVAQTYAQFLNVALRNPAVTAVLTWGLSDRYTWLKSEKPRNDGLPVRPLPLDENLRPKPAWTAMSQAFASAAERHAPIAQPDARP
jgi:endo-1,4-beta-xylanase